MSFEHAAAFIFTYGTAHYALVNRAGLRPGETVLVLGASGGVGLAGIQIAKSLGARVIAAASSQQKLEFALREGADLGVIYEKDTLTADAARSFGSNLKSICGPGGVDVVLDPVGGLYAEPALRSVGIDGRYLVVGFTAGIPKIPLNLLLLKSCQMIGVDWGSFVRRDAAGALLNAKAALGLYSSGSIKPVISQTYSLQAAPDAIRALEQRTASGKMIINMGS